MKKNFFNSDWARIWIQPREVLRQILDSDPRRHTHPLAMLGGFGFLLTECTGISAGKYFSFFSIFFLCAVVGPLSGLFFLYLEGALLTWTGRWLGGGGTQLEIRAACAWRSMPYIWAAGLLLIFSPYFGKRIFSSDEPVWDIFPNLVLVCMAFLLIALVVWAWLISLKCVAEAHRFSVWKALGTAFLARLLEIMAWGISYLMFYGIGKFLKAFWAL